jgi:FkbM family methyltransferase
MENAPGHDELTEGTVSCLTIHWSPTDLAMEDNWRWVRKYLSPRSMLTLVRRYRLLSAKMRPDIANRLQLMRGQAYGRYPLTVRYRSGIHKTVENPFEAYDSIYGFHWSEDPDGAVSISFKGHLLRFAGTKSLRPGEVNGDFLGVFLAEQWSYLLPVTDRTVIDIGANIGDTAIYFLLSGARRVVGVEPFRKSIESARINCRNNGYGDRVTLLRAAVSSEDGTRYIDEDSYGINAKTSPPDGRSDVPELSLESICAYLEEQSSAVLKVDCNGCENLAISGADFKTLRRFERIGIEYETIGLKERGGTGPIVRKLRDAGFRVSVWPPMISASQR